MVICAAVSTTAKVEIPSTITGMRSVNPVEGLEQLCRIIKGSVLSGGSGRGGVASWDLSGGLPSTSLNH